MSEVREAHRQEQLDIVLRLNKLTKRGVLAWERHSRSDLERRTSREAYVTNWEEYHVIVEEAPPADVFPLRRGFESEASYRLRIRLRHGDVEDDWIVIPPMPAIDDLVSTIQRVNDEPDRVKGDLDDLRSFKEKLDEAL
jgi:hypothetical protein